MASEREGFTSRPDLVLLPAMLCDGDLYRPQIEVLSDLVHPFPRVVAELSMADAARLVLRDAPSRFLLAGMSYGGCLAIEVAITAPQRVAGLWLMGCNPGPHGDRGEALSHSSWHRGVAVRQAGRPPTLLHKSRRLTPYRIFSATPIPISKNVAPSV